MSTVLEMKNREKATVQVHDRAESASAPSSEVIQDPDYDEVYTPAEQRKIIHRMYDHIPV